MNTYIALFRGINVGGHNKLPMRELVHLLEKLGLESVKTYIQSGNVVFQSERTDRLALSETIGVTIGESHGFTPQVFILNLYFAPFQLNRETKNSTMPVRVVR